MEQRIEPSGDIKLRDDLIVEVNEVMNKLTYTSLLILLRQADMCLVQQDQDDMTAQA